jgi:hypothetical protein
MIDSRNGTRQPQVSKFSPSSQRQPRITISDRIMPAVAVI